MKEELRDLATNYMTQPSRRNQSAVHSVLSRFLRVLRSLAIDAGYAAPTAKVLSPLRFREKHCQESKDSRLSSTDYTKVAITLTMRDCRSYDFVKFVQSVASFLKLVAGLSPGFSLRLMGYTARLMSLVAALLTVSIALFTLPVAASAQPTSTGQTEEWDRLTPEQKEQLRQKLQAFKHLTPEQQQEILSNLDQFRQMRPEERKLILQNYGAFQQLNPEERSFLRQNFQRWKDLPPERREQLRNNYRRFLQMNTEQRKRFLENYRRWQSLSPQERARLRREGIAPGRHGLNLPPGTNPPNPPRKKRNKNRPL